MYEDRLVQPRQIYASTVSRRDRRWTRRRGRTFIGVVLVSAATLLAALTVLATVAPGLS
jgi:ABC-type Fe3+ transport system permease subunit